MKKLFIGHVATLMFFMLVVFLMTFPLVLNLNHCIAGYEDTNEPFAVLHNFWWLKVSFLKNISYQNEYIMAYPFGAKHPLIFIHPLWHYLARYLSVHTNEIFAYNCIILVNLVLAALMMFYLVQHLTKDRLAAIFSGIIYALCPYQFARLWQHFSLTFTQWMPLYMLSLIKLYEHRRLRYVLYCAAGFFLSLAFDFHYAFFMLMATFLFFLYTFLLRQGGQRQLFRVYLFTAIFIVGISLLTLAPFLRTFFLSPKTQSPSAWGIVRPFEDLFTQSAKPLSYLLPAITHPVFGKFTQNFLGSQLYGMSLTEHALYLGWIPLILAFIAFRRRRTEDTANFYIRFFLLLAVTAWIFSQPPWWNMFEFKIYMPSFFIYKALPMFRAYCRFGILVMLAIAVLAGFGLKYIIEKARGIKRAGISFVFLLLVLFEFINLPPFKIIDLNKIPEVYLWLRKEPDNLIIAEYPLDTNGQDVMYMFYQTKHNKRMINGTIPGSPANEKAREMLVLSNPKTLSYLKESGVNYIIVHRDRYKTSGLVEDMEELNKIKKSPILRLVKTFKDAEIFQIVDRNE